MGDHYNDMKSEKELKADEYLRVDKATMPKVENVF